MAKIKNKLSSSQKKARKAAKKERKRKYRIVFMNGKQVRVKREPTVDGIPVDQYIAEHADPIWLHQNGLWELMPVDEPFFDVEASPESQGQDDEDEIPF